MNPLSQSEVADNSIIQLLVDCNLKECNTVLDEYLANSSQQLILDYLNESIQSTTFRSLDLNQLQLFIHNHNENSQRMREFDDEIILKLNENCDFLVFLINLVKLSKTNKQLIRLSSSAMNLLIKMDVDLWYQDFSNIEIEDTNLSYGNLAGCNLDCSKFTKVNITGLNLNGASLQNAEWLKLQNIEEGVIILKEKFDKIALLSKYNMLLLHNSQNQIIRLYNYLNEKVFNFIKQKQVIQSLALSNNGYLALGESLIRIFSIRTGKLITKLSPSLCEREYYQLLTYSEDGSLLGSLNSAHEIKIWEIASRKTIEGINHNCASYLLINNGYVIFDQFIVNSDNKRQKNSSLLIWNIQKGMREKQLDKVYDKINAIYYDTDFVVVGTSYPYLQVWDKDSNKLPDYKGHQYGIQVISYQKELRILATGGFDCYIILWNTSTWQQLGTLIGHYSQINFLQFIQNTHHLISCSKDKTIRIWNIQSLQDINRKKRNQNIQFNHFWVTNDQKTIFMLDNSFYLKAFNLCDLKSCFDVKSNVVQAKFDRFQHIFALDGSKNDKYLIILKQFTVQIKNIQNGNQNMIEIDLEYGSNSFLMLTNEIGLNVGQQFGRLIYIKNKRCLLQFQPKTQDQKFSDAQVVHAKKMFATVQDKQLKVWQQDKLLFTLTRESEISLIEFSQSGRFFLLKQKKSMSEIWSISKRNIVSKLLDHQQSTIKSQFTPNDQIVITASYDFILRFWRVENGVQLLMINCYSNSLNNLKIVSLKGNCKLYVSNPIMLQMWNLGECNPDSFQPICYKVYSKDLRDFTADYAKLSGSIFTNSINQSLKKQFEYQSSNNLQWIS